MRLPHFLVNLESELHRIYTLDFSQEIDGRRPDRLTSRTDVRYSDDTACQHITSTPALPGTQDAPKILVDWRLLHKPRIEK